MGSYLNPGNFSFRGSLRSKIYIDKSGLISKTNETLCTEQKYICVSRPRRFGKSMAANMLAAYYDRSESTEELFKNLSISKDDSYKENNFVIILFCSIETDSSIPESEEGSAADHLIHVA